MALCGSRLGYNNALQLCVKKEEHRLFLLLRLFYGISETNEGESAYILHVAFCESAFWKQEYKFRNEEKCSLWSLKDSMWFYSTCEKNLVIWTMLTVPWQVLIFLILEELIKRWNIWPGIRLFLYERYKATTDLVHSEYVKRFTSICQEHFILLNNLLLNYYHKYGTNNNSYKVTAKLVYENATRLRKQKLGRKKPRNNNCS